MKVAVMDHSMGNLRSVAKALEAAGADVVVSADPDEISRCEGLCVPGQGIFGRCMTALGKDGLGALVTEWIEAERPYLGICLGMQILFEYGGESEVAGLGLIGGEVTRLQGEVPIPHIGWNEVYWREDSQDDRTAGAQKRSVSTDRRTNVYYYFDHSFVARPTDDEVVSGWCEHGERFAASITSGSVTATQFHPEKSGDDGISLLKGWVGG